jgi:hypothetical protein
MLECGREEFMKISWMSEVRCRGEGFDAILKHARGFIYRVCGT